MGMIPRPEYPRPDRQRSSWQNLNGEWAFRLFPAGAEEQEQLFARERGTYDRTIQVPFSWASPLSGVHDKAAGVGWYRRSVRHQRKGRLFLCFGAVDYLADVYVNGQHAGRHIGIIRLRHVDAQLLIFKNLARQRHLLAHDIWHDDLLRAPELAERKEGTQTEAQHEHAEKSEDEFFGTEE